MDVILGKIIAGCAGGEVPMSRMSSLDNMCGPRKRMRNMEAVGGGRVDSRREAVRVMRRVSRFLCSFAGFS